MCPHWYLIIINISHIKSNIISQNNVEPLTSSSLQNSQRAGLQIHLLIFARRTWVTESKHIIVCPVQMCMILCSEHKMSTRPLQRCLTSANWRNKVPPKFLWKHSNSNRAQDVGIGCQGRLLMPPRPMCIWDGGNGSNQGGICKRCKWRRSWYNFEQLNKKVTHPCDLEFLLYIH